MSIMNSIPKVDTPEQFKEVYYQELHKRMLLGMKEKAERGEFPGCAPVGYLNVWQDGRKTIIIDPVKGSLIQECFDLAQDDRLSVRRILQIMTEKGLTSRNGKKLGVSALWSILTNPFYVGKIRYDSSLITGSHSPLILRGVFSNVQKNLEARSKRSPAQ